jgi:hypothetical protein
MDLLDSSEPGLREQFLRACIWLDRSLAVWHESMSLSYIALTNAIETLAGRGSAVTCRYCGARSPGVTEAFRDFLGEYAGQTDEGRRNQLYDLRSQIVHGDLLMVRDIPGEAGFHPTDLKHRDSWYELRSVARIAVLNWFVATATRDKEDGGDSHE